MHAHGIDIGAVQQGFVGAGVIALDPVDQLILAQEFGAGRGGRVFSLGRRAFSRRGFGRGGFERRRGGDDRRAERRGGVRLRR